MNETRSAAPRPEGFDLIETELELGPTTRLKLARVRDVNALVDAVDDAEFSVDERLPYWATLWPSARALATFLLEEVTPRGPAIELGAGLGLASVALASRGLSVVATDYEPAALRFCAYNAALNGVRVETALLDWRKPSHLGPFATLVAADVLYEARQVTPLVETICDLLAKDGEAFVADPLRPHLGDFERAAQTRGLALEPFAVDQVMIVRVRFT